MLASLFVCGVAGCGDMAPAASPAPAISEATSAPSPLPEEDVPTTPPIVPEDVPVATAEPSSPVETLVMEEELTFEENLADNPPPPQNVRVTSVAAGAVHLSWDLPPPVTDPHNYSDRVVEYRIFRRVAGELEFRPLALTAGQEYIDRDVQSGTTYEYAVSSIREQNAEGSHSDPPVVVTVP
jgi:hypothetical protein